MRGSRSRGPRLNGLTVVLGLVFRTGDNPPLVLKPLCVFCIRGEGGPLITGGSDYLRMNNNLVLISPTSIYFRMVVKKDTQTMCARRNLLADSPGKQRHARRSRTPTPPSPVTTANFGAQERSQGSKAIDGPEPPHPCGCMFQTRECHEPGILLRGQGATLASVCIGLRRLRQRFPEASDPQPSYCEPFALPVGTKRNQRPNIMADGVLA